MARLADPPPPTSCTEIGTCPTSDESVLSHIVDAEKLRQIVRRTANLENENLSEADTKRVIVEPILSLLGWDIGGIHEVKNEYRAKSSDNPVDYGIFLDKKPAFLLEAKPLGHNIGDRKCITQTVAYASTCGTEWAVITNGKDWAIYNALAPVDAEKKLFRKFSIDQDGADKDLSLLQKSSMGDAKIKRAWDIEHAVKQVLGAMRDLVAGRNRTLVSLVRKNTAGLARKDIESALLQLDITVSALPADKDSIVLPPRTEAKRRGGKREEQASPKGGTAISRLQEFYDSKWKNDPGWFDRHRGSDAITRKTRRWFGKSVEEIYMNGKVPISPKRVSDSDWLFDRNVSAEGIRRRIETLQRLP